MSGVSRTVGPNRPAGMHVLERLRDAREIDGFQYESVLQTAIRNGQRIEDALIDTATLDEAKLLKFLAGIYQTRFVSTERLARATIDRRTLERLPVRFAERLQVFPVVYDTRSHTLSVVTAAPGEDEIEKQVQMASGVRDVRCYIARPAAIRAAIAKHYRHDPNAFADLGSEVPDYDPLGLGGGTGPTKPAAEPDPFSTLIEGVPRRPTPGPGTIPAALPSPGGTIPFELPTGAPKVTVEQYVETIQIFVTLLEQDRGDLRGHSAQVARLARRVAERAGVSSADRHALTLAAQLHDLGKGSDAYHLTALNVARYEGHRTKAKKSRQAPLKLFGSTDLPEATVKTLEHLYERFDGQGFPDGLSGKDIPFGARVLALVETYHDLTANARNPYRRVLAAPEAVEVVRGLAGQLFDPTLADVLRLVVLGESGEAANRPRALVVEPDPEEITVLEMRLIDHGFVVRVARDLPSATEALAERFDVVITELDLDARDEGLALLDAIGKLTSEARPHVLVLTARSDRGAVSSAFDKGADDFLVKPASAEVVATKAAQALDGPKSSRGGVSGSLKEMSLPDVVQILANGRKSGRLNLVSGGRRGHVCFSEGQIVDAAFGEKQAEEAFYAMLKLEEGNFNVDPNPPEVSPRRIQMSAEGLLLEGMRRMDEGLD